MPIAPAARYFEDYPPGADALRPEKVFLMVAEDHLRLAVPQQPHDFIREPVFVDAVAETDQFLDIAHQLQRPYKATRIAMDIGYNAQPHCRTFGETREKRVEARVITTATGRIGLATSGVRCSGVSIAP